MNENFHYKLVASTKHFMPKTQLAEYIDILVREYSGKGSTSHQLDQYVDTLVDLKNPIINSLMETIFSLQALFVCTSPQITGHELDGTEDKNYPYHSQSGENMALFHYFSTNQLEEWWIVKIDSQPIQRSAYGVAKSGNSSPFFCYIDLEELINRDDVRLDVEDSFTGLNEIPQLSELFQ